MSCLTTGGIIWGMKKTAVFLLLISISPFAFIRVSQAFANTTISVTNNGSNSSSHVKVNSSTTSNNTTTTSSNGHTSVRIESNGETKTYESDGNESLHMESTDGKNKVDINNKSVLGTSVTPNPTISTQLIRDKKAEMKKVMEDEKAKIKSTITSMPKQTISQVTPLRFDVGLWIRTLFASLFK